METTPRFATITRPNNPVLLVKLSVDMEERGGTIEIVLPHTTLEPIRELLLQMFMGEKFGQDVLWERHFNKEVRQTEVVLEAVMDERKIMLAEVLRFAVGGTLLLDKPADAPVTVKCGGVTIATGRPGTLGDHIAVSLDEIVLSRHGGNQGGNPGGSWGGGS
jgi:flagellar motor switch protein FliM